jgi:hemerythrin-like metal-binding protein
MSFFDWKDEFSVKIAAIDKQHRKIVELMNELFESLRDGREEYIISEVLEDLSKYTEYHFGLEAALFKKYAYKKTEEHLSEHGHFVQRIGALRGEVSSDAGGAAAATLEYLREWFQDHMLKVDIDYSRFFESMDVVEEIEADVGDRR